MGKTLRTFGILLLSGSAFFNLAGGAGTTCVTISPEKYPGFEAIAKAQFLYYIFVIGTFAFGVMMSRAVYLIIKRRANAYRYAMISLVSAIIIGVVHILVSRSLRGGSMPVDAVVYTTVLTTILFLIFRIPTVWEKVDFTKGEKDHDEMTGGLAAMIVGFLSLIIQHLMRSTHTINGINYGDAFHITMNGIGTGLIIFGIIILRKKAGFLFAFKNNYRYQEQ